MRSTSSARLSIAIFAGAKRLFLKETFACQSVRGAGRRRERPRVVGEVVISKDQTTERENVSDTVRREEVHVDRDKSGGR